MEVISLNLAHINACIELAPITEHATSYNNHGLRLKNLKLLKPGDEVIIPILTWPTHIWSAMMAGLKVKLVDVDINTCNICLIDLNYR